MRSLTRKRRDISKLFGNSWSAPIPAIRSPITSRPVVPFAIQTIHDWILDRGYDLRLGISYGRPDRELALLRRMAEGRVAGLLLSWSEGETDAACASYLREVVAHGMPVVFVGRRVDGIGSDSITVDNRKGTLAVTEYLLEGAKANPRTLFATHFHELTQLRNRYPRLVNLKITIKEWEAGIIFLRKIVPGTSDKSFGIHAAKVAGLPTVVIKRAEEILASLELRRDLLRQGVDVGADTGQFSLFARPPESEGGVPPRTPGGSSDLDRKTADALRRFDVNNSTPLEALQLLKKLKDALGS